MLLGGASDRDTTCDASEPILPQTQCPSLAVYHPRRHPASSSDRNGQIGTKRWM